MKTVVITTNGIVQKMKVDNIGKLGGGRREIKAAQESVILYTTGMP